MTPELESNPIFDAAHRIDAEGRAEKRLAVTRARMVLRSGPEAAFFLSLLLRLDCRARWDLPTMAVDGKRMFYNPDFTLSLSDEEIKGVLIHEVLHLALQHHTRRGHREPKLFNIAADLALNPIVLDAKFALPKGCLVPGQEPFAELPSGLSAEEYYSMLPEHMEKKGMKADDFFGGGPDPGGCGGVLDASKSEAERLESEREWKQAVAEAAEAAKTRGKLPGALAKFAEDAVRSKRCYREVLRRFVTSFAKADHTWMVPNRRFAHRGLFLPSLRSESLGLLAVNVDTSGSVWNCMDRFAGEIQAIVEPYACELAVSYSDTRIQGEETWSPGDGPFRLKPVGGGGTDHHCVFEWLAAMPDRPACLICLTDGYTSTPASPPDVPVLWVVVGNPRPTVLTWGEIIHMDPEG